MLRREPIEIKYLRKPRHMFLEHRPVLFRLFPINECLPAVGFVIRCGTPDCDWGKKMCDLGEEQLRLGYSLDRHHAATDLKLAVRPVDLD